MDQVREASGEFSYKFDGRARWRSLARVSDTGVVFCGGPTALATSEAREGLSLVAGYLCGACRVLRGGAE